MIEKDPECFQAKVRGMVMHTRAKLIFVMNATMIAAAIVSLATPQMR